MSNAVLFTVAGLATPIVMPVADRLAKLQGYVGGLIEIVDIGGGWILICNEEGKLHGLPVNRAASVLYKLSVGAGDPIVGPVLMCRRAILED